MKKYRCFNLKYLIQAVISSAVLVFSSVSFADDDLTHNPEWLLAGHDYANSSNNQQEHLLSPASIAAAVAEGGLVKQTFTMGETHNQTYGALGVTVPIVKKGIVYGANDKGNVFAIDIKSGTVLFNVHISDAGLHFSQEELQWFNALQGAFVSTPVVTEKYLFIGDTEAVIYKLDRFTGAVLSSVKTGGAPLSGLCSLLSLYFTGQLVCVNNVDAYQVQGNMGIVDRTGKNKSPLLVFGLSSFFMEETPVGWDFTRGSVVGVNADTMQIEWQAFTTSDQNLTTNPRPKFGGGVSVWAGSAIDTKRKLIYIGTGDFHSPPPRYSGSPSDDMPDLTDSLIAINYDTGQIVDHVQFVSGDVTSQCYLNGSPFCDPSTEPAFSLQDPFRDPSLGPYIIPADVRTELFPLPLSPNQQVSDVPAAPQLFTIQNHGKPLEVVGVSDKNGTYYVLDRDNLNHIVWQTPPAHNSLASGANAGGSAIDYANKLIWFPLDVFDENFNSSLYIEALAMDTGEVKVVIPLPGDFTNGSPSIANNVLYIAGASGILRTYDITHCCDESHQPTLIMQDAIIQNPPPFQNFNVSVARAPAIVDGKIFVNYGQGDVISGMAIYSLPQKGK